MWGLPRTLLQNLGSAWIAQRAAVRRFTSFLVSEMTVPPPTRIHGSFHCGHSAYEEQLRHSRRRAPPSLLDSLRDTVIHMGSSHENAHTLHGLSVWTGNPARLQRRSLWQRRSIHNSNLRDRTDVLFFSFLHLGFTSLLMYFSEALKSRPF